MSKQIKIGLVFLIAIVIAWFGINYLKGSNVFNDQIQLKAFYNNVDGLTISSPVSYNGLKVGRVKEISINPDSVSKMSVMFSVDNADLKIPNNSVAQLNNSLIGGGSISLILGDSKTYAQNGDTLLQRIDGGIAGEIKEQFLPLKQKTEELVAEVDQIIKSLNVIFSAESTQKLPKAFESLEASLKTLETTSTRVDGMIAENREKFGSVMSNVDAITTTFKDNSGALDTIISNFSVISDSIAAIEFAAVINQVTNTLSEVADITEKINNGNGSLGQLINSDSLVVELQQSNQELQYLLNDIYTHPKKYLSFSVVGRKDRNGFSDKEEDRIKEIIKDEK